MADDAGQRTEAPTPRRRADARQRGQVARSTDLSSAVLLLGALICLRWFGPMMIAAMYKSMHEHLSVTDPAAAGRVDMVPIILSVGMAVLSASWPVLAGLIVLGLLSNFLQVGFLFTAQPLELNLNKLSPLAGISRMFSTRTIVQLA